MEEVPLAVAVHRDEGIPKSQLEQEGEAEDGGRNKRGVLEAQLSLPEVVNVNVTHAMVSAVRTKALALSEVRKEKGKEGKGRAACIDYFGWLVVGLFVGLYSG